MIVLISRCVGALREIRAIEGAGEAAAWRLLRQTFPRTRGEDMRIAATVDTAGTPMQLWYDATDPDGLSVILSGDNMIPLDILDHLQ